jgi:hypothetical protein
MMATNNLSGCAENNHQKRLPLFVLCLACGYWWKPTRRKRSYQCPDCKSKRTETGNCWEIRERIEAEVLQGAATGDVPTGEGEEIGALLEKMPDCNVRPHRHGAIVDEILPRKKNPRPKEEPRRKPPEKPAERKRPRHKELGVSEETYVQLLKDWEEHRVPRDDLSLSADAYWIEGRSKTLEKKRRKRGSIRYFDALRLAKELRNVE